jgi:hypothetical protein
MKKSFIIICISVVISQLFTSCTNKKEIEYKEFYSQIIGFSQDKDNYKAIENDSILMIDNSEYTKFADKYFTMRKLPIKSPNTEKAVLFLQIPSDSDFVDCYITKSVTVRNNTLTVNLEKNSEAIVDGDVQLNWKWVILLEIDKSHLKENMKIVVNKVEKKH